jgi:hypothetical protein
MMVMMPMPIFMLMGATRHSARDGQTRNRRKDVLAQTLHAPTVADAEIAKHRTTTTTGGHAKRQSIEWGIT